MYYFAYGSNMSVKRMDTRKTDWMYRAHAVLEGYELTFDKAAGYRYSAGAADDSYFPTIWHKDAISIHKPVPTLGRINKRAQFRASPVEGYATIRPQAGCDVHGVVYVVPHSGITALDGFEGFPSNYTRELMRVKLDNGAIVTAYTYVAAKDMVTAGALPSDTYLAHLLDGREMLPEEYFQMLANHPTVKDTYRAPTTNYPTKGYTNQQEYYDSVYGNQGGWD